MEISSKRLFIRWVAYDESTRYVALPTYITEQVPIKVQSVNRKLTPSTSHYCIGGDYTLVQRLFDHLMFVRRVIKIACLPLRCAVALMDFNDTDTCWKSCSCPAARYLAQSQAQPGTTHCPFHVDPCDSETPLDHHTDSQVKSSQASTRRSHLPSYFLTSSFLSPTSLSLFLGAFIPWCCAGPITTHCLTRGILQRSRLYSARPVSRPSYGGRAISIRRPANKVRT